MTSVNANSVETILEDELACADRALKSVAPILGYMLSNGDQTLVSDAVLAKVRGMLAAIARQVVDLVRDSYLEAEASFEDLDNSANAFSDRLADDVPLLTYLHGIAMEAQIAENLSARKGLDPVLSPLWQELIASVDPETGEIAMNALTAQSRFMQAIGRMQFDLFELPSDMFERVLRLWGQSFPMASDEGDTEAIASIKSDYDEAKTRLGLLTRLVASMRGGAIAALELEHAGFSLFASALASLSGQDRAQAVLACHDNQSARLAIALRAAGQDRSAIERQFLVLEPSERVPEDIDTVSPDSAKTLLSRGGSPLVSEANA